MQTKDLERVSLVPINLGEEIDKVLEKAAKSLGYTPESTKTGKLSNLLIMLDIQPFSTESVKKYKSELLSSLNRTQSWARKLGVERRKGVYSWTTTSIHDYKEPIPIHVLSKGIAVKDLWTEKYEEEYLREVEVCKRDAVENDMLATGPFRSLYLAPSYPKSLYASIEHLQFKTHKQIEEDRLRALDPFLMVALGEEKYYIEVWDEPEFKG